MESDEFLMSPPINPNNFPAKLWRLVNNPRYQSICWDSTGGGIVINQQLFESELLCPSKTVTESNELFKTSNFTSFIRQLNLYGFKKLMIGSGGNADLHCPSPELGAGDGNVHHYYNDNFRKGQPDLLVKLKRLTSTNKAKLAAGLEVNTRPPNRFQRSLTSSLPEESKEDSQGLMPIEEIQRTCRSENISPYPYVNPPSHNHITFPGKELDHAPVPPRTWSNSFGLHQRHVAPHSSFPEKGMYYPLLQHFPADITYTMQSTATSVHVQQGCAAMPGSVQRYSSYMPHPAQYAQAYYPSAIIPCYPTPAHLHHLNGPSVSPYQHYSYFQSPPMHRSFPMEFIHTNWSSDELRNDEMNLESVFQFADELQSSSQLEIVKLDTAQNLVEPTALPTTVGVIPGNEATYCTQTSRLESLLPVNPDITNEALLADLPVHCQSPLTVSYVYPSCNDHTEVDVTTFSDADEALCGDKGDSLACNITSQGPLAQQEYKYYTGETSTAKDSAGLNPPLEEACKLEPPAKKKNEI